MALSLSRGFRALWLMVVFTGLYQTCYSQPVVLDHKRTYNCGGHYLRFFKTADSTDDIRKIVALFDAGGFRETPGNVFNSGIPNDFIWFSFSVRNTATHTRRLLIEIQNSRINKLTIFSRKASVIARVETLGDFFPFNRRSIEYKNFVIEEEVPPGTSEYFLFIDQRGHAMTLPVVLHDVTNRETILPGNYLKDGLTYGGLLFAALLGVLFFATVKQQLYLYYGLYILTAICWFFSYFGLGFQYVWAQHPPVNTWASPLFASLNIIFNLRICQLLLDLKLRSYHLHRAANSMVYMLLCVGILPVVINLNVQSVAFNKIYLSVFLTTIIIAVTVVISSIAIHAARGYFVARFYGIASLLKVGSIMNLALMEFGLTPALFDLERFLQIGIIIEILLLTVALSIRYASSVLQDYRRVIAALENERMVLSDELHNGVANRLSAVYYALRNLPRDTVIPSVSLKNVEQMLQMATTDVRTLSHRLPSEEIKDIPISMSVGKYVDSIQKLTAQSFPPLILSFEGVPEPFTFRPHFRIGIYWIAQELLGNVIKHAMATHAKLAFSVEKRNFVITCEDDGSGFHQMGTDQAGMGLRNIRSRIKTLNGSLLIESAGIFDGNERKRQPSVRNTGTIIKIRLPLRRYAHGVKS